MNGTWVRMYQFYGDGDPEDPALDGRLGLMAKDDAIQAGYHPTDDDPAVVWSKNHITGMTAARVVVIVTEKGPLP